MQGGKNEQTVTREERLRLLAVLKYRLQHAGLKENIDDFLVAAAGNRDVVNELTRILETIDIPRKV